MSAFNCQITYKKVEGNSYLSTYNKLISQGFIDKYLNVKVDIATWRKGRSEINEQASTKLGYKVNLFAEKKLLNGIRAVPDMKLFGIIDSINKNSKIITTENFNIYENIYSSIDQPMDSLISNDKASKVQEQIDQYNKLNMGKQLSLVPVLGQNLIKTEYKANFLYKVRPEEVQIKDNDQITNSNNEFNSGCI